MRRLTILVALALVSAVAATEAAKPPAKPPKPTAAAKPTMAKTQPPKGSAPKASTVKGSSVKGSTVKATGAPAKASSAKSVKPAKADAKAAKAEMSGRTSSPGSNTNVTTTRIDFTATGVGQKLEKNTALRSKIEAKLQAAGYTGSVYEGAYGFKNIGQFNAATNQVQNHGYSFDLLKVLMTGTYVDPTTHTVYRANQLPNGTVNLVRSDLATNPTSTLSLGQAKQAIAAGREMPEIVLVRPTAPTGITSTSATSSASSVKSKTKRKTSASTVQPGGGSF
jgi:hypothetical protein